MSNRKNLPVWALLMVLVTGCMSITEPCGRYEKRTAAQADELRAKGYSCYNANWVMPGYPPSYTCNLGCR